MSQRNMHKLGIILIHYGAVQTTYDCLASVSDHMPKVPFELYVIDNDPIHRLDALHLASYSIPITYRSNPENVGFAPAVNQGLDYFFEKQIPYFFLLNNDVQLVDDSLDRMISLMDQHPEIAVAGGILNKTHEPNELWQAGWKLAWHGAGGKQVVPDQEFESVDYVPGATFLGRLGVQRFDPAYFMYYEETDYCCALRKEGQQIVVVGNTQFLHHTGGRDRSNSPFMFYYLLRNGLYFNRKFKRGGLKFFANLYLILYNGLRAVKYESSNRSQSKRSLFFKSYFYALKHYFKKQQGAFPEVAAYED